MPERTTIVLNKEEYSTIEPEQWDDELIKEIAFVRNLKECDVNLILQYSVISFRQMALICGVSESNIRNLTTEWKRRGGFASRLSTCNPFPDDGKGKKFVLVDEKCRAYIEEMLKVKAEQ